MSPSVPSALLLFRSALLHSFPAIPVFALYAAAHWHLPVALAAITTLAAMCGALWTRKRADAARENAVDTPASTRSAMITDALGLQDQLTGIANRPALEAKLAEEWKRDRGPDEPTGLLLLDLDGFEDLRECVDPIAADVALLTVARSLSRMLPRRADLLARYGASTFGVVLPGTDLPGALRVAARLRWAVLRLAIVHPQAEAGYVTTSVGLAVQHGVREKGGSPLLTAAVDALLLARRKGPDSLEYTLLQGENAPTYETASGRALPSLPAWAPEPESLYPS